MKNLLQLLYRMLYASKNLQLVKAVAFVVVFLLLNSGSVQATHVIGGYITYECLGDDEYMIQLTVKRDCEFGADNAPFDDPANIAIFDRRGRLMNTLATNGIITANFMGDDTISNQINSSCFDIPEEVCVHRAVYRQRVRLPFNPEGYILAYQRCCRNGTLRNIVEPLESGSTMTAEITPAALTACNSAPDFVNNPSVFICSGKPLFFNARATDSEGDSLVYRLDAPSLGASIDRPRPVPPTNPPYDPVVFSQGYSLEDLMGGTPLEIHPETGMVTATPRFLGQYLVGIAIDEYRDGVLLSTIRRDFQYNVVSCDEGRDIDFVTSQDDCESNTVNFEFPDIPETVSYLWDFDLSSDSPADISTEQNPSFTYGAPGEYVVQVVARLADGICEYTDIQTVQVIDNRQDGDFLEVEVLDCNENSITYAIEDKSEITYDRDWETSNNIDLIDSLKIQIVEVAAGEEISVSLLLASNQGCTISDTVQLVGDLNAILDFEASITECQEDRVLVDLTGTEVPFFTSRYVISGEGLDDINLEGANHQITIPTSVNEIVILRTISNGNCVRQEIKSLVLNLDNTIDISTRLLGCDDSENNKQQIEFVSEINNTGINPVSYEWRVMNSEGTLNFDSPNIVLDADDLHNSQIFLTVGFDNGCEANKALLEEELPNLEEITMINVDGTDCMDESATVRLSNNNTNIGDSIQITAKKWTILNGITSGPGSGDLDFDRCAESIIVSVSGQSKFIDLEDNPVVCTDFLVQNFNTIGAFQFGVQWTPNVLDYVSIDSEVDNFESARPDTDRPELRVSWFNRDATPGLTLPDGSPLFTICFNQSIPQGGMAMTNLVSLEDFDIEFLDGNLETIDPCVQQAYFIDGDSTTVQTMYTGNSIEVENITNSPLVVRLDLELDNGCIISQIDTIDLDFIELDFNPKINNDTLYLCSGTPEQILVNPNPNYTYSWTPTTGLIIPEPGREGEAQVNPSEVTTYTLTVSNGTCEQEYIIHAIPENDIDINIVGDSLTCNGTAELIAQGGSSNYQWSLDPNFENIIGTDARLTYNFTGTSQTFYVRSVINDGQCHSNTAQFVVMNSAADVDVSIEGMQCIGDTVFVRVSSPSMTDFSIQWEDNPAILSPLDQNPIAVLATDANPIELNFSIVNSDGCTYDSEMAGESIVIQPMPKAILGDVEILMNCISYEVCFQSNLEDGQGVWDFDINSQDDENSTDGTACYVYPGSGTYTASVSSNSQTTCGFETQLFTIDIPEVLFMDVVEAADSTDIVPYCDDQEFVDLTLNTNVPTDRIYWYSTADTTPIAVGPTLTVGVMEYDSIYAGYLTADCEVRSQVITFAPVGFDFSFSPEGVICGGQDQMITLVGSQPENFTYSWTATTPILDGQGTSQITVNTVDPFEVMVTVTDIENECTKDYSQTYDISILPDIVIQSTEGDTIFEGESTDLSVVVPDGSSVLWSTGETSTNITVSPTETTIYTVEVTNEAGCVVEAQIEITVIMAMCAEGYVFLPNAFSPNNDGRNDILLVRSKFIKELSLDVYDRWGELVFNTTDQDIGWNGQFRNTGDELAPDAYAYVLRVVCINDEVFMDRGNVSIIR